MEQNNENLGHTITHRQNPITFYLRRFFSVLWNTIKTPASMLKAFVEAADYKVALGFILSECILTALISVCTINEISNRISSIIFRISSSSTTNIVMFFSSMLYSIVSAAILIFILFFFTYGIFKYNVNFKQIICIASSKYLAQLIFSLIGFAVLFINPILGLIICNFGTILGYFFLPAALKGVNNMNDNKCIFISLLSFVMISIISFVIMNVVFSNLIVPIIRQLLRQSISPFSSFGY